MADFVIPLKFLDKGHVCPLCYSVTVVTLFCPFLDCFAKHQNEAMLVAKSGSTLKPAHILCPFVDI